MKNLKSIVMMTIFAFPFTAIAQEAEEEPALEISGSVDTYYTADFSGKNNISTSFADDRESISIGMLDLGLSKAYKNVSFTGEVSFGPRSFKSVPMYDPDGDGEGPNVGIQNLYMSYAFNDKFSLTAGYMGTFVGYEIISPTGNFNYSTSYLFTSGPFQNAGLKADYAFSDNFAVMVGVFNDWNVYTDPDEKKDFGVQIFFSPAKGLEAYVNFVTGSATGTIIDLTTGYQISDAFYLGLNAANFSYHHSDDGGYTGVALYPQYAFSEVVSVGIRSEYFKIKDSKDPEGTTTGSSSVLATTVSANFKVGEFTFIPEIRIDSSEDFGFINGNDEMATSASQLTLAAVYAF